MRQLDSYEAQSPIHNSVYGQELKVDISLGQLQPQQQVNILGALFICCCHLLWWSRCVCEIEIEIEIDHTLNLLVRGDCLHLFS